MSLDKRCKILTQAKALPTVVETPLLDSVRAPADSYTIQMDSSMSLCFKLVDILAHKAPHGV